LSELGGRSQVLLGGRWTLEAEELPDDVAIARWDAAPAGDLRFSGLRRLRRSGVAMVEATDVRDGNDLAS